MANGTWHGTHGGHGQLLCCAIMVRRILVLSRGRRAEGASLGPTSMSPRTRKIAASDSFAMPDPQLATSSAASLIPASSAPSPPLLLLFFSVLQFILHTTLYYASSCCGYAVTLLRALIAALCKGTATLHTTNPPHACNLLLSPTTFNTCTPP